MDLRTWEVHTWEVGGASIYSANYGHKLTLQKLLNHTVCSLQQTYEVISTPIL